MKHKTERGLRKVTEQPVYTVLPEDLTTPMAPPGTVWWRKMPVGVRLAVVGGTALDGCLPAYMVLCMVLEQLAPSLIISGGARGVDQMAVDAAKQHGIPWRVYQPEVTRWVGHPHVGFSERNQMIADDCQALVCIRLWDAKTYGSGWTRDRAAEQGKPTYEFKVTYK